MKLRISLTLMLGVYAVVNTAWQILPLLLMLQWYICAVISVIEQVKNRLWGVESKQICFVYTTSQFLGKAEKADTVGRGHGRGHGRRHGHRLGRRHESFFSPLQCRTEAKHGYSSSQQRSKATCIFNKLQRKD